MADAFGDLSRAIIWSIAFSDKSGFADSHQMGLEPNVTKIGSLPSKAVDLGTRPQQEISGSQRGIRVDRSHAVVIVKVLVT